MSQPMSSRARLYRIVAGAIILGLGLILKQWWGAIGILPIIGGLLGACPLCNLFSNSGCKKDACEGDKKPKQGGCCGGH